MAPEAEAPEAEAPVRSLLPAWLAPASAPAIALTVALAVIVAVVQDSVADSVLRGAMMLALVPCSLIDLDRRIIPNRITGPASLFALVAGLALDPGGEPKRLLWAAVAGAFLLVAALVSPSGMGMGDVKLLAMIGLFIGRPVIIAALIGLLATVLTGLLLAPRRGLRGARKTALPFGPYLAAGALVAALVGDQIIHWYLQAA